MNSASTADSSFTKSIEHKENEEIEEKEPVPFHEVKEPKQKVDTFSKKVHSDQCFVRNIMEKKGPIYIFSTNHRKILISKIRLVNFPMNRSLFDKGKLKFDDIKYVDYNSATFPEMKFWQQRYYYYSKFDEGIQMDNESWYSVTPEELAKYTAIAITERNSVVVDAFSGSGGNVIQFSKFCKYVHAIDIDPNKIAICQNNCKVYHCADNINFIRSDFLKMENKIEADYIFLSPPWGGVEYKDCEYYSIKQMMSPDIFQIIKVCLSISKKIIFYLPRTTLLEEFYEILDDVLTNSPHKEHYMDYIFINIHILNSANKSKAVILVLGNSINDITCDDMRKYIKFNYRSLNHAKVNQLLNLAKILGNEKFLRSEYAFRTNYDSQLCSHRSLANKILFFAKTELLTSFQQKQLAYLNHMSALKKHDVVFPQEYHRYSWNNKVFFVDDRVLTEEEYHKLKGRQLRSTYI